MDLFKNEIINISKIISVDMYVTTAEEARRNSSVRYNSSPRAYELIYFLDGSCTTDFCGTVIEDIPDSIRYLPKGNFIGEYIVKNRKANTCVDIYFDTDEPMPMSALSFTNMSFLKNKFIKIHNAWSSRQPGYYSHAFSIFYDIVHLRGGCLWML